MLEIDMKPAKGILFVRLKGILNETNISKFKDEVIDLIKKIGVKNIVFNVTDLKYIDVNGMKELLNGFNYCKVNNGFSLFCSTNTFMNFKLKNILDSKYIVGDELTAIKLLNA